jgi:hypothetical protein
MPQFEAFRFGPNTNPASRSKKSSRFDTPTFAVQLKAPLADQNELVFGLLTKATVHTVVGPRAASDFEYDEQSNELHLSLVCDDCYPLTLDP